MKKIFLIVITMLVVINTSKAAYAYQIVPNFYDLFNNSRTSMLLFDADNGDIEYANQAAADFYGYDIKTLVSMSMYNFNVYSKEQTERQMLSAEADKKNYFVVPQRLAGGDIKTVEIYASPYEYAGKRLLFAVIYDITARAGLEKENNDMILYMGIILSLVVILLGIFTVYLLRTNKKIKTQRNEINDFNELIKTFINAEESQVYLKDENFRFLFANKALEDFYHTDASLIIGQEEAELAENDYAVISRKTDFEALEKRITITSEIKWKDRVYSSVKFPVKMALGKYGVGAYIRDVTNEYNKAAELTEANKQLKENEKDILYLSYHDSLTGLYNRRFIDEEFKKLNCGDNLPLSVIMGDVNGLKITNDIFGHKAGDQLLKESAEVMKKICRSQDIVARIGGDEFILLLPRTSGTEAGGIADKIRVKLSETQVNGIRCSISLGIDTMNSPEEDIYQVLNKAEAGMYTEKTLDHRSISSITLNEIIRKLHEDYPAEKEHALNVSSLCESMGRWLKLSTSEAARLKNAAYLHDIGKIVLEPEVLNEKDSLGDQDWNRIKQHTIIGYRLLNASEETMEIAKYVLSHHERWDGKGYPNGLKGEAIPKLSRIIALAESYDCMTHDMPYQKALSREEAITEILRNAGSQFDPQLTENFADMMKNW